MSLTVNKQKYTLINNNCLDPMEDMLFSVSG